MNTVQSAAVMAMTMREAGHDVLHLSTALCPRDRSVILARIQDKLEPRTCTDWTLVATSLMEAGVDVSFRTPFRERFATASLIQIGGRGNRNSEWPGGADVHDFIVDTTGGLKRHPKATISAGVLEKLFEDGLLEGAIDPAGIVTLAMKREIRQQNKLGKNALLTAEDARCYPEVAELGRVIDADTRVVVVDAGLRDRIVARERLKMRDILAGSVQIWADKIAGLGLDPLPGRQDIFWWPHHYDPDFLGYMKGALFLESVASGGTLIYS
jgi:CRISPR-associated endonuclease/helicase Cas3